MSLIWIKSLAAGLAHCGLMQIKHPVIAIGIFDAKLMEKTMIDDITLGIAFIVAFGAVAIALGWGRRAVHRYRDWHQDATEAKPGQEPPAAANG